MQLTRKLRRDRMGLFNVAEAARQVGVPAHILRYQIAVGQSPGPSTKMNSTNYFTRQDLQRLMTHFAEK